MNNEEALEVAQLVAKLWPSPGMDGVRCTFYARALTAIPEHIDAVNAVSRLFLTERFQPTPGEVIEAALDLGPEAVEAWEALRQAARLLASRTPGAHPPPQAVAALRAAGWKLGDLPVDDNWRMEKIRQAFHQAYVARAREAAATPITLDPAPTPGARPIDTTTSARRL